MYFPTSLTSTTPYETLVVASNICLDMMDGMTKEQYIKAYDPTTVDLRNHYDSIKEKLISLVFGEDEKIELLTIGMLSQTEANLVMNYVVEFASEFTYLEFVELTGSDNVTKSEYEYLQDHLNALCQSLF